MNTIFNINSLLSTKYKYANTLTHIGDTFVGISYVRNTQKNV